jgi:hypothetical protein
MRGLYLVPVLAGACTTTAPFDYAVGTFERHDEQGRVIDRLKLGDDGTFVSECQYYWPIGPAIGGDYSLVRGTYKVHDDRLWLQGTTRDGFTFHLDTTFFADDTYASLAPYMAVEGTEYRQAIYHRTTDGYTSAFAWALEPELYLRPSSYLIGHVASWGDTTGEGGDYVAVGSDRLIFDDTLQFRVLDGGAVIARDEPFHRCLDYDPSPYDNGMLYERAQPLR